MDREQQAIDTILSQGILPLYFYPEEEVCVALLRTLYAQGIRTIEFTNRGKEALANFKALLRLRDAEMPGMLLGIGTIKNTRDAYAFIEAGADYIISPGFSREVALVVQEHKLLYIPGCATATELMAAEEAGCRFVKIFPGNVLGTGFLTAVKELFPGMLFMPTGGVEIDQDNIGNWFKAGVSAVGLGSKLISKVAMEHRDYAGVATLTRQALDIVSGIRKG